VILELGNGRVVVEWDCGENILHLASRCGRSGHGELSKGLGGWLG
jgi:hypothetical protein